MIQPSKLLTTQKVTRVLKPEGFISGPRMRVSRAVTPGVILIRLQSTPSPEDKSRLRKIIESQGWLLDESLLVRSLAMFKGSRADHYVTLSSKAQGGEGSR
jgi:hypothetical protein